MSKTKEITLLSIFVLAIFFSVMFFYQETIQMKKELQQIDTADSAKAANAIIFDSSFQQIKK